MTAASWRTLGLVLLVAGVVAIALGRFSSLLPHSAVWIGLGVIVAGWIAIGLSFRAPRRPEP